MNMRQHFAVRPPPGRGPFLALNCIAGDLLIAKTFASGNLAAGHLAMYAASTPGKYNGDKKGPRLQTQRILAWEIALPASPGTILKRRIAYYFPTSCH